MRNRLYLTIGYLGMVLMIGLMVAPQFEQFTVPAEIVASIMAGYFGMTGAIKMLMDLDDK